MEIYCFMKGNRKCNQCISLLAKQCASIAICIANDCIERQTNIIIIHYDVHFTVINNEFYSSSNKLFNFQSLPTSALPHVVRDELPEMFLRQQTSVTWEDLTQTQLLKLWNKYNSALLPAYEKNKLGVVIFQVISLTQAEK